MKDTTNKSGLKVVAIEEVGFPYCIGSIGAQLSGDGDNTYGYASGNNAIKYTIEVGIPQGE